GVGRVNGVQHNGRDRQNVLMAKVKGAEEPGWFLAVDAPEEDFLVAIGNSLADLRVRGRRKKGQQQDERQHSVHEYILPYEMPWRLLRGGGDQSPGAM